MATNIVVVTARVAKVPTIAKSGKGVDYAKFTLVEDTADGPRWYDAVAFGGFARLVYSKMNKGSEAKFVGPLTLKEYQKRDGGVGTSNNLIINKVVLEGGVELDKFSKAPETVEQMDGPDTQSMKGEVPF